MQNQHIFTVGQLTHALKLCLESTFPNITMQGEISNFKLQSSGHLYFSLKDSEAQISAVMFRGDAIRLKGTPKSGDHVIVRGEINVYPPKGNYQFIVREMTQVGLGELLMKLEQLKMKLQQLGWFDQANKKPLPKLPRRIGVVTSPTGAVIQDILHVLTRRFSGIHLILNPVKVQGPGAAEEIARAIDDFNRYEMVDVMIVGRGGGTLEDLWAFNEEIVAAAIHRSNIPIISAVGHETDYSIADFVADVRAPTPSAAAEIVIAEKAHQVQHLLQVRNRMDQMLMHQLKHARQRLRNVEKQPILTTPYPLLGMWMQKVDDMRVDLDLITQQMYQRIRIKLEGLWRQSQALKPTNKIAQIRLRLSSLDTMILSNLQTRIAKKTTYLQHIAQTMKAIDPKNLLRKGYSIIFSEHNTVVQSITSLKKDERIRILVADGEAGAVVTKVDPRM
jgi:exodeoxyribonuclease VII large subunit